MKEGFPSAEKLKSTKLIGELFSEGKSITQFPIKLVYLPIKNSEDTCYKCGVSVPKRNFKKAVHRNRLKRLIRETYRKNKYIAINNIAQPYAFMFIYLGKEKQDYSQLFLQMEKLLKKFVEKENFTK